MTDQDHFEAARIMRVYGGGFAGKIADAWFVADSGNKRKLEAAFADLFWRYRKEEWPDQGPAD